MQNDKCKMRHRNIGTSYTRTDYIRRIPEGKQGQMKFTYGDCNKAFEHELRLVSVNEKLLSINSLDAVRVAIGHILGDTPFFMRIHPITHEILREHGLSGMAKSERLVKGMRQSFGASRNKVAHVHKNQIVITLRINNDKLGLKALDIASKKLACDAKIEMP